jgi:hypothetical protein
MNSYEAKIEAKRERLERAAERAQAKAATEFRKADLSEEATGIPFGQPILVGHHSERRHRNVIARANAALGRSIEASKRADELAHRAETYGTHGISSDDPEAIAKLREELAGLEERHERMKRWNKQFRSGGADAMDAPESINATTRKTMELCPYLREPFTLTNSSANIRRIKERIAQLEKHSERETAETLHNSGVRMVENAEENRVQLFFPGKPAEDTRKLLKQSGFRWAPSEGAWQRQLNTSAVWAARRVLESLV